MKDPIKKRSKDSARRLVLKLNKMLPVYPVNKIGPVNPLFRLAYFTEFQKAPPLTLN